jgi:hypothetical protein
VIAAPCFPGQRKAMAGLVCRTVLGGACAGHRKTAYQQSNALPVLGK